MRGELTVFIVDDDASVRDSLARDIIFTWTLTLNGEPTAPGE